MIHIKDNLEYYAGSRDFAPGILDLFNSRTESLNGTFYRGMPFPKHRLVIGEVVEEWHGSSHWSLDKEVSLNFAIINKNGYINEDYYDELVEEIGEENVDFKQVVFVANKLVGVKLYSLLEEYGINSFANEKEITTIDKDFKIKSIKMELVDNEEVYFVNVDMI